MLDLIGELFPICRSITGAGLRQSLKRVGELIPLATHEVPTGTQAFDWTVPKEWNIADAYIKDTDGRRIVDFRDNNLHVVNYSAPVNARMSLGELRPHLHSLPDRPDWIPYRTTYYAETWGFCLPHRQLESLPDGEYEVVIDSSLRDGALTYGECVLPGEVEDEFLISTHICHPSLANDNLSGVAVAAALAQILARTPHRYTYRFLFVPGTIGPIAWLSRNQDKVRRIKHGLVLACVGDRGSINYKRSRRGSADIDRAVECVLRSRADALRGSGLLALRLRRAAVLLSGLRSSRRKLPPHAAWRIPGVPYVCRQSRLRVGRASCRLSRHVARGDRSPRERCRIPQSQPQLRAAIGEEGAAPGGKRECADGATLDAQSVRR